MTENQHPENPWDPKEDVNTASEKTRRNPAQKTAGYGREMPPDIDEVISRFVNRLGKNGTPPSSFVPLFSAAAILLLLWAASGIYRILPEEQAVVLRFGALDRTVAEPGLGYHLPSPIESIITENVTFERRLTVGFEKDPRGNVRDIPAESLMLTGDANIIDIDFTVQWKISNLPDYLFRLRDPENSIKKVAESVMREVVGQNNLQLIITEKRSYVSDTVQQLLQSVLDSYHSGITVTQVLIEDATVPPPVMDAFEDVVRAAQDAETAVNKAQEYRNDIVPQARGKAIGILQDAQAYKEKIINTAKGEAGRFDELFKTYNEARDVTENRLYIETMEEILKTGKTVISDRVNGTPFPYFSVDRMMSDKPAEKNAITRGSTDKTTERP